MASHIGSYCVTQLALEKDLPQHTAAATIARPVLVLPSSHNACSSCHHLFKGNFKPFGITCRFIFPFGTVLHHTSGTSDFTSSSLMPSISSFTTSPQAVPHPHPAHHEIHASFLPCQHLLPIFSTSLIYSTCTALLSHIAGQTLWGPGLCAKPSGVKTE